jgi:hypothetical protein
VYCILPAPCTELENGDYKGALNDYEYGYGPPENGLEQILESLCDLGGRLHGRLRVRTAATSGNQCHDKYAEKIAPWHRTSPARGLIHCIRDRFC